MVSFAKVNNCTATGLLPVDKICGSRRYRQIRVAGNADSYDIRVKMVFLLKAQFHV
jgi:hypothetical protein